AFGRRLAPSIERQIAAVLLEAFGRWESARFRRAGDDEVNLTAPLVGMMLEVVRERRIPMQINPEVGEYTKEQLEGRADARHAGRVDISISAGFYAYDPQIKLECKRLGRGATARQYVDDGLVRFVS